MPTVKANAYVPRRFLQCNRDMDWRFDPFAYTKWSLHPGSSRDSLDFILVNLPCSMEAESGGRYRGPRAKPNDGLKP